MLRIYNKLHQSVVECQNDYKIGGFFSNIGLSPQAAVQADLPEGEGPPRGAESHKQPLPNCILLHCAMVTIDLDGPEKCAF